MAPESEQLLNNLKLHRVQLDLTQAELAAAVGVSRKTINTVENGVFIPSTLLALKIAKVLQTQVEVLFYIKG
ncbi:helix-turn-helix transcriptional regulator [Pelagibacterium limicola]|uniref:helix-turn-helix transcriptional regulator n=1 Tax=Pelagibacterium limicola TaxID=2791022 RepID=UPI0018AF7584|nr:helix-turn-helix transcriptional regulator [Pelagibacterium limicola]